jgi:hypothetical protein
MRQELEFALAMAKRLPTDDIPRFLGEIEEVRQTAVLRLHSPAAPETRDELLNVVEARPKAGHFFELFVPPL